VEVPDRRYALGVQWHPEADEGSRLIASLVEAAGAYRRERAGSPVP
jgi:putative glutamine amidotransferase